VTAEPGGAGRRLPLEDRLVFLTACGEWADEELRRCLHGEVDWRAVLALANAQYATSEVWHRLNRVGRDLPAWPPDDEAVRAIRRMGRVLDFQMGILQERLEGFLGRLESEGLEVVLLKGAATGWKYFGGFRHRPMGDVDLLFAPHQAERAHQLAQETDWELPRSELRPHMYEGHHHLIQLEPEDGLHFALEVHTDLFPEWGPFRFSGEDVRRRARSLAMAPAGAPRVPSPEDQLLHTCLHFAWSHTFHYGTWRTIRDVDALLADRELDLDVFARRASDGRGASCVHWSLAVIQQLVALPLPEDLLEALEAPRRPIFEGPLLRHLTHEARGRMPPAGIQRLRRALWTLAVNPSRSGHGSGRPWTRADRWPGPSEGELALPQHRPSTLAERARGLTSYLGFLARGLVRGPGEVS
jgi:hypothetical protein